LGRFAKFQERRIDIFLIGTLESMTTRADLRAISIYRWVIPVV